MKSTLVFLCTLVLVTSCTKQETATPTDTAKPQQKPVAYSTPASKTAKEEPAELPTARTDVGDPMPAYSATYLDGKPLNLASEKGNVVFLNVWATWCGPCRFETPELQSLQNQYGASGLKVIGVSVDEGADGAAVKTFVNDQKITYAIALDPDSRIANLVQTTVLPASLLIDRRGKIVWRQIGAIMPNDAKLKATIEKAVAEKH